MDRPEQSGTTDGMRATPSLPFLPLHLSRPFSFCHTEHRGVEAAILLLILEILASNLPGGRLS
jgi:hypothetical protein